MQRKCNMMIYRKHSEFIVKKFSASVKIFFLSALLFSGTAYSAIDLADDPLFLKTGAGANVLLNMSVETPMGGAAYNDAAGSIPGCGGRRSDNRGICYFESHEYIGYFDPNKCYQYSSNVYVPTDAASSDHTCDDGQTGRWSGNFLNWAGMTAIDIYMLTLTGGRRVEDTTSRTVIERTLGNSSFFHDKVLDAANNVAPSTVTPYTGVWAHINRRTDSAFDFQTSSGTTTYQLKVEVCNSSVGLEENCVARTDGSSNYYKPEGLIQRNDDKMRFGVMAYTTDGSNSRQGGVLRNNMKFVGPETGTGETNSLKEYGEDGIFIDNPHNASSNNSGVINYVNKFAVKANGYKVFDPVSELFYEAIRYFKNLGPTLETYDGLNTSNNGGFPIITNWDDPIQYECQKNFMVAINDAFPWNDKSVPGTYFEGTSTEDALERNISHTYDTGEPSNADDEINATELTDTVGSLEDTETGGELTTKLGTNELGKLLAPGSGANLTPTNGDSRGNSYYVAGLAYYANTTDLRADSHLPGDQTVTTFMIDSQEFKNNPILGNVNPLWLTGKYGGFNDENNDDTPQAAEWDADNDGAPDNYVLATEPAKMVSKLQESFDEISKVTEASGSSVAINSTVLRTNSRIYQGSFASTDWSGELKAFSLNPDGTVGNTVWQASAEIPAHTARKIYTTVDVNGTPTAKEFTDSNVTLGGSGSSTVTTTSKVTGMTATAISECNEWESTGYASKVVDGNTNGSFPAGSVNHTCGGWPNTTTDADYYDWLDVDMGANYDLNYIDIYNRSDGGHQKRLSNAILMVADTPFSGDDLSTALANADFVAQLTGTPTRINAGSSSNYTDTRGRVWEGDSSYIDTGNNRTNSDVISGADSGALLGDTTDAVIYQTLRGKNNEVRFDIPISNTGIDYFVILHFSDDTTGADFAVDVEFDDNLVLDDFEIGSVYGQDTAVTKIFKYTAVESILDIDINEVSGGNPRINAIEVIPEISATTNLITTAVGIQGRYIRVQKAGQELTIDADKRFLHLAEIEPYADITTTIGGASNADIVNYIRGDQTKEIGQANGIFRTRSTVLGDIVDSSPVSASTENFVYDILPGSEGSSYASYVTSKISKFKGANGEFFNIVYVGANDGMLHAFQDTQDTSPTSAGKEIFAYIPSHLHSKLENLTEPDYQHEYFVNATPHVSDVYINSSWKTMLVGALGAGGKGLYALDVSDPKNFGTSDVMWEFKTDSDTSNGSDEMGFILSEPQLVRLHNGKFGMVFGNGYNSTSHKAQLFILDAEDGSIIKVIDTGVGSSSSPNGLAEPFLLDEDADRIVDTVYAGDLHGNMWKFDVTGNVSSWDVAYDTSGTPAPLYKAEDANGNTQMITSRPSVVNNPKGGFNVLFGTGKYIEIGDNIIPASPDINTFYSINDNGTKATAGRTALVKQEILAEVDVIDDKGNTDPGDDEVIATIRITSENTVNYASQEGWYMDLVLPDDADADTDPEVTGERVIVKPLTRFGRAIFTTFTPSANPCTGGGTGALMEIDALSGSRLGQSVFDVNGDGLIDANDFANFNGDSLPVSGIYIPPTLGVPAIISAAGADYEFKLTSGTGGQINTIQESTGSSFVGRQSWRQLQ